MVAGHRASDTPVTTLNRMRRRRFTLESYRTRCISPASAAVVADGGPETKSHSGLIPCLKLNGKVAVETAYAPESNQVAAPVTALGTDGPAPHR